MSDKNERRLIIIGSIIFLVLFIKLMIWSKNKEGERICHNGSVEIWDNGSYHKVINEYGGWTPCNNEN